MEIYFDHAATTPMVTPALEALLQQATQLGNASSLHSPGRLVRKAVEEAREVIADVINCAPNEIIFTGSGTEANNLAIKGFFWSRKSEKAERNVIVTSAFEHHAILDPIEWLREHEGAEVVHIPITPAGFIDVDFLRNVVGGRRDEISLIAVMHSNNEIGTVQPIREVVEISGDIPVHTDAVQSFGKVPFSFAELGVTSATVSAHKIGGPLGIAALILGRGIDITPILHGGGQERDIRSGTINAPAIVSFAAAAEFSRSTLNERTAYVGALKSELMEKALREIPDLQFNGRSEISLPGIINMTFPGTENEALLLLLDSAGIAASTGSACSAGVHETSHVLLAMGLSERDARSSLRFSLGSSNTSAEIDEFARVIGTVVGRARAASAKVQ
ncbi:MAG: cysteine desulfurase family protein [Actinomycetes bacterium]